MKLALLYSMGCPINKEDHAFLNERGYDIVAVSTVEEAIRCDAAFGSDVDMALDIVAHIPVITIIYETICEDGVFTFKPFGLREWCYKK